MKSMYESRSFARYCLATLLALGSVAACAVQSEEPVASSTDALYQTGELWPNGTVRVCWMPAAYDHAEFLTKYAPTVRRRANEEWPTAARISFVGWLPCPTALTDRNGMLALELSLNDPNSSTRKVGYFPNATNGTIFGDQDTRLQGSVVPHELGHALGFAEEVQRPGFDLDCKPVNPGRPTTIPDGNDWGTTEDFNSIMASTGYCQDNSGLSAQDREGVARAYGARVNHFATSTGWATWPTLNSHTFADVDGDGRADLVGRVFTGEVFVARSSGSGFGAASKWTTWDPQYSLQLADVNRDGRADLVGRKGTNVQVALATGSGFQSSTRWTTWATTYDLQLADVDGDGRADIIGRSGTDVQVGLSTGTKFATSTRWTTWVSGFDASFADVTGDGRADIIGRSGTTVRVGASNGAGFFSSTVWTAWDTAFDHRFVDVNGDGRADLVGRSGDDVQVGISNGGVFQTSTRWTRWATSYDVNLADANGDGRADIVGRSGSDIQVGLATN